MSIILRSFITISILVSTLSGSSQHCHESGNEPHAMAPIGVMGGHMHSKGHFMSTYRYMPMAMSGLSKQGTQISATDGLDHFTMVPASMTMQMHMLGMMYAPHDRVTLMVMSSYRTQSMTMLAAPMHGDHAMHEMGGMDMELKEEDLESSEMQSSGFGDTKVSSLIRINKDENLCLHGILGLRIPTGSVSQKGAMGMMPYGMQNGIGSLGLEAGLNFSALLSNYLIGAQARASIPLHENKRGYRASDQYNLSIWGARKLTSWASVSARVNGHYQSRIWGSDALINPMMSPAGVGSNEELSYGLAMLGMNFKPFEKWRLAFEAGMPFVQWNAGIHMNQKFVGTAGLQFSMN